MTETRIQISSVLEGQLPEFVREEFPLVTEFLTQYYLSLEGQGGTTDILQNIDQYVKIDNLTNLTKFTTLNGDVSLFDSTINVNSTYGFADRYGLLLIDDEIITYTGLTTNTFTGCIRGFSGVTSYQSKTNPDQLVFSESNVSEHSSGSTVQNLSILFLSEFFKKVKKQITPGFEDREFYPGLNDRLFAKQTKDFYSSKGTNTSFEILFRALYGKDVEVIKPRDFLFQPSDAQYSITKNLIVEEIEGNPLELENATLYQDPTDFFSKSKGTVVHTEKLRKGDRDYYLLNLDYSASKDIDLQGTVLGTFSIHPKTQTTTSTIIDSTVIDVDSTIGFPNSGTLRAKLYNETNIYIEYGSKTTTQFFDCKGVDQEIPDGQEIALDAYAYGYVGIGTSNVVRVRITGVLSDLEIETQNQYYNKGDIVKIKTLGKDLDDYKSNNWIFNISTKFDVDIIELLDSSSFIYKIYLYDNHRFFIGDSITLISSNGLEKTGNIIFINDEKSFTIQKQGELNTSLYYIAKKNIAKANANNYPELSIYETDIQNVYSDLKNSLYITSPSIPYYLDQPLTINDRSVTFSGTFDGTELNLGKSHGFYTGDSVVYSGDIIANGIYFIKKIDDITIQIARSRANIDSNNFVYITGDINSGKFSFKDFCYENLESQLLEPQKLVRNISEPENDSNKYETPSGLIGIFINGVEILNYKSKDNIYYGPIENIDPISPGFGYDIVNPPILTINDSVGTGASAYCSVNGGLERIDIIDPGFDYLEEPLITISGGNGIGAVAKTKLVSFDHSIDFNSQANSGLVNLTNNTIGFSSYHKFRDVEEVIYDTNKKTAIVGLTTNSSYFVSLIDAYTVKLHKSFNDAVVGINTIDLTGYGTGNHTLRSKNKKKKIGSIYIENSGYNYQNKKTIITSVGIDTAADIINIKNHGYNSGEIISYTPTSTPIGGLSTSSYYVTSINENQFKLSQIGFGTVGLGTEISDFYYQTKQYINLTSSGSGNHIFNYQPINVNITGTIGVSLINPQNFNAIIQPIFRGEIKSVFIENGGSSYGSENIINYNKQPQFLLNSGSGAQVTPIISGGKIVDIIINSPGAAYNSPPNLIIQGDGTGAILTPVLSNGTIISVNIISGGGGYNIGRTFITVFSAGEGAIFSSNIKSWKINLVQRLITSGNITEDDGILDNGINNKLGLQYTHAYSPRSLRKSLLSKSISNGSFFYTKELDFSNNKEQNSTSHSPILGWAYDGNPIYGPYGYENPSTGGNVKLMVSGYVTVSISNRPSGYPIGFFVEDYEYQNNGDLDEFNGRFCITPDYPNGIYAYFCVVGANGGTNSPFKNYKTPVFPYVIGNYFRSKPIEFNYLRSSNQDDFDFKSFKLLRNTTPYNLNNQKSRYDYILNPNKIQPQLSEIKNITSGSIQSIEILSKGDGYKVGDSVVFNTENTGGRNLRAQVSTIEGKQVSQISVASSSISNVEFIPFDNFGNFIGFATFPHNFLNNDLVTATTQYENKKSSNIIISQNVLNLTSGIGSVAYTGIVTYFNVSGFLNYPNIKENDIYQIQNEQIKVLNIDQLNSRVRVLRNYNNTSGLSTYGVGVAITENTRKIRLNFGISSTSYQYNLNRELYFDPKESVGLGTTSGVGIVSTIYFSNPAAGIASTKIPTRSIYLPNHQLNTGDSLIYSSNGGTTLSISTDGKSSFNLTNKSIVYTAKISNDLIGISTLKVGLGSTGTFVGIGSTTTGLLYFTGIGTGVYHSFTTRYKNTLVGQVDKNVVIVSTSSTIGLSVGDSVIVDIKPGISTTVVIRYDDYNRRLVANPKSFTSANVNILNDTITINNHKYNQGQKIIHTSSSPSGGLVNEKIYYVVVIDSNTIKLSETLYSTKKVFPDVVDITSSSFGTISQINPLLNIYKNQTFIFDVSDPSLSFIRNSKSYPAFDLNFYTDSKFKNKFKSSSSKSFFEVIESGSIGISTDAKVFLNITENITKNLYYKLDPVNFQYNTSIKKEIVIDDEQINFNQLNIIDSGYNGNYNIIAISTNSFNYNILNVPEKNSYSSSENDLKYYTNSPSAYGPIHLIDVKSGGNNFTVLPGISSVKSQNGNGAILKIIGSGIGSVSKKQILDIGFDYSSDYTIRPIAKLPTIVKIDPYYSFESIGITSSGKNYNLSPNLVVLDGFSGNIVSDVILNYQIGNTQVEILKNTKGLYNIAPKIIPINNSNGIGISSIRFDSVTKDVTVTLSVGFSTQESFPFNINDKVLIENISVGIGSDGKGYNSDIYNYTLFTLKSIDPNIGGYNGSVVYNMGDYLSNSETPGIYDPNTSLGTITPEKYFPKFNSTLKKNSFYDGETIISNSSDSKGIVQKMNENSEYLKISTSDIFKIGDTISGSTSFTKGVIIDILSSGECVYDVESFSIVKNGWKKETGFLSNNLQRIHDGDYYQYFSYSLRSEISLNDWINPVNDLNHTAGFKKFSDLIIESHDIGIGTNSTLYTGISTSQNNGDFVGISNLSRFVDLNCVNDFDLVKEISIYNNTLKSNEIIFDSKSLQDYVESVGNRVLDIDDISGTFNSDPRSTQFSVIDSFQLNNTRSKKYLIYIADQRYVAERQVSLVSLLHNNYYGFLNQYAIIPTVYNMGFFDFYVTGDNGNLVFYPTKTEINNFTVNYVSYDMKDTLSGIGTNTNLGDIVNIGSGTTSLGVGISTAVTIVGIASTYRSSKVLVQIGATNSSYYQYDELTVIHDGTNVNFLGYGQLTTNTLSPVSSSGLGTYNAYLSGSKLNIDFTPRSSLLVQHNVSTITVSISNTSSVGVGTTELKNNKLSSNYISIASSTTPIANIISSYNNQTYSCAYCIVSIEDTTNNRYQVSEVLLVDNKNNVSSYASTSAYVSEFGVIQTNNSLGTISADVSSTNTNLYFTPISGINAQVRVFQHSLGFIDIDNTTLTYNINF
jgi:hypothetical protein